MSDTILESSAPAGQTGQSAPQKKKKRKRASKRARQRRRRRSKLAAVKELLRSYSVDGMIEQAKGMDRRFVFHCGPTNSGKTYAALQALKRADSGQYLGPLRLLALEVFDSLNMEGVPCSLLTGEERIDVPMSAITASTVEMCDYRTRMDVAVIDEAQMAADPHRGGAWLKALLQVDAAEVHVCIAPEAMRLVRSLIRQTGSPYTVIQYGRLAPLVFSGALQDLSEIEPGDCLIAFSRQKVLSLAAALEDRYGLRTSVIYGALPPISRRSEVQRFVSGESSVVVATDAIGMGVSLPIKRIIFTEVKKFDGQTVRQLLPQELKQIAGRAGRYGIYDKGEVLTMEEPEFVENCLSQQTPKIPAIMIPFPTEALSSEYPLDRLLECWKGLPERGGFARADMGETAWLYKQLHIDDLERVDKRLLFRLCSCGVDVRCVPLVSYWKRCCAVILDGGKSIPEPDPPEDELESLETAYKCYDAMHQLCLIVGVADEVTARERQKLTQRIDRILSQEKGTLYSRCQECGAALPVGTGHRFCDNCFEKRRLARERKRLRRKAGIEAPSEVVESDEANNAELENGS